MQKARARFFWRSRHQRETPYEDNPKVQRNTTPAEFQEPLYSRYYWLPGIWCIVYIEKKSTPGQVLYYIYTTAVLLENVKLFLCKHRGATTATTHYATEYFKNKKKPPPVRSNIFVETHLCKMCVILRLRVLLGVCPR